jgi:phosphatidate cytidylyltransferase
MNNTINRCLTSCILLSLLYFAWVFPIFMTFSLIISCVYILIFEWPLLAKNSLYVWLITPFYIVIPFLIFLNLNFSTERDLLFACILIIAAFDSGSYVCGKLCGTHRLCPSISPNKTVEGVVGGVLAAYTTAYAFFKILFPNTFLLFFNYFYIFIICFFALCGDLFESWLKRKAGLKDSGSLLPGHGGLLDRFDSYLWISYFLIVIKQFS